MDFKTHFETAWKNTLNHIVPLVLMTLALMAAGFMTLGILAPVCMAGYMQSVILMLRENRPPHYKDIFTHLGLFLPLLGFGIGVTVVGMIGLALLVLPGIVFILAVGYCCLYMLPLMTDQQLGLIEAIKKSFAMVTQGDIAENIVVFVLFAAMVSIGGASMIGALLVQPFATAFLGSVYLERSSAMAIEPLSSDGQS
ncbi:MAG: hypothetical protein WBG37_11065 [Desulfobacterales bacterium]